jgi:PKD repeat protein
MKGVKCVVVTALLLSSVVGLVERGDALEEPFPVYGTLTDSSGNPLPSGVTVTVRDQTRGTQTSVSTESGGYYQADLLDVPDSANGDLIEVSCSYDGEDNAKTFVLDTSATSREVSFSLIGAPAVTTNDATGTSSSGTTLNGELTVLKDSSCDVWFQYGKTKSYGSSTSKKTKTAPAAFSETLSELEPDTTYHFRAVAKNSRKTTYGADKTFHTQAAPPDVTTNAASSIGYASATLNGYLNEPGASNTEAWFVYDTESHSSGIDNYPYATPKQPKSTASAFSETVTGLAVDTTYYFRAVAKNDAGTDVGTEKTFTTQVTLPSVETHDADNITSVSALLHGQLTDLGGDTSCSVWFEYGTTTTYGFTTGNVTRAETGVFAVAAHGLTPGTTYHFRAAARNGRGFAYGEDLTFTTQAVFAHIETGAIAYAIILQANVTDTGGDDDCTVWFEYWEDVPGAEIQKTANKTVSETGVVTEVVSALNENATYLYRPAVHNSRGTVYGQNLSFKMFSLPQAPDVATCTATVAGTNVSLSGNLTSMGDCPACYVWFEYWNITRWATAPRIIDATGVFTGNITGLSEGKRYWYRAVAVGSNGRIAYGTVGNFTTNESYNQPPEITLLAPANDALTGTSISLMAEVTDADNDVLSITFYWSNDTAVQTITGTGGIVSVACVLSPGTAYAWYVAADDGKTRTVSDMANFTTAAESMANFTHTPAFENETVYFTGTSSGPVEEWRWDFGDGVVSYEQNATHTYRAPGTYMVNLTVTDTFANFFSIQREIAVWRRGDATMDGRINALDITRVKRIDKGLDDAADYPPADADGDGIVDATDVAFIITKILEGS